MRFPWRPPDYAMTCAQCGTTWRVPGSARRWRSRLASRLVAGAAVILGAAVEADPAAMAGMVGSISERNRAAQARYRCPRCHTGQFARRTLGT